MLKNPFILIAAAMIAILGYLAFLAGLADFDDFLPTVGEDGVSRPSAVRVEDDWHGACPTWVAPASFDLDTASAAPLANVTSALAANEQARWPVALSSPASNDFDVHVRLTGTLKDEAISIRNPATVSVIRKLDAPDQMNVVRSTACSSGAIQHDYPPVALSGSLESTNISLLEIDALGLVPGETEHLVFHFGCVEPGVYQIALDIPIVHGGVLEVVEIKSPMTLICHQSATYFYAGRDGGEFLAEPAYMEEWVWTGDSYRRTRIPLLAIGVIRSAGECIEVHSEPAAGAAVEDCLPDGTQVVVYHVTGSGGSQWGKLSGGRGWIRLAAVEFGIIPEDRQLASGDAVPAVLQTFIKELVAGAGGTYLGECQSASATSDDAARCAVIRLNQDVTRATVIVRSPSSQSGHILDLSLDAFDGFWQAEAIGPYGRTPLANPLPFP